MKRYIYIIYIYIYIYLTLDAYWQYIVMLFVVLNVKEYLFFEEKFKF